MQEAYDHDRVSQEFKRAADLAGSLYRSNVENAARDVSAAASQDEFLARLCVYGYLYDRHFLQTRDLLLAELRWLLATDRPNTPRTAINSRVYDAHRSALLKMLIARFQRSAPDVIDETQSRAFHPRISAEMRLTGVMAQRSPGSPRSS